MTTMKMECLYSIKLVKPYLLMNDSTTVIVTGIKTGRSFLIDDGALPWIVHNANNEASPIRRHIELALCHLAQHGKINP